MIIASALAGGISTVQGVSESDDIKATLECVRALGAKADLVPIDMDAAKSVIKEREEMAGTPVGAFVGLSSLLNAHIDGRDTGNTELPVFPCNESGSTLRFFIPIALALTGGGTFTGTPRLIERGISVYEELFEGTGIEIEKGVDYITVKGKLTPGEFKARGNVSSQFVTGLFFALPLLESGSIVELITPVESRPYIDITMDALASFGIKIEEYRENVFRIPGNQKYEPGIRRVESDWSAASVLFAFNEGTSSLSVKGLNENSVQGDRVGKNYLWALRDAGERLDISSCPDLGPVLFSAAALRRGGTFTGTRRLQIKESDRAAAMAEELSKIGVDMVIGENEVEVHPAKLHTPGEPLSSHNDHRIVMALTVVLSVTGGIIEGAEAVNKSWPTFFDDMSELGLKTEIIE